MGFNSVFKGLRLSTPATTRLHYATVSIHRTGLEPRTGASGDLERSWRRTRCNTADVTWRRPWLPRPSRS